MSVLVVYMNVRNLDQITLAELQAVAKDEGITIEKHDIMLIRTGRMAMLYEEGMQRQWSSAVDIPWHEIPKDLPTDIEMAMCTRWLFAGSGRMVCRQSPPPPGCHRGRCGWS